MRINREGYAIIATAAGVCAAVGTICWLLTPAWMAWGATVVVVVLFAMITFFFRDPQRTTVRDGAAVFSPCDGRVVQIKPALMDEYFGGRECIQVSIFMSMSNVHANFYPVSGRVTYYKYHAGRYLVAWHPKSSELNEHTTIVVDTGRTEVMFRQIAGFVARRIVTYAEVGRHVEQGTRCGFIKLGSRLDVFLPPGAEMTVGVGDRVKAAQSAIARLAGERAVAEK